jgi:hypothetical protein
MKKTIKKVGNSRHVVPIKRPLLYLTLSLLLLTTGVVVGGWSVFRQVNTERPVGTAMALAISNNSSLNDMSTSITDDKQYLTEMRLAFPAAADTHMRYRYITDSETGKSFAEVTSRYINDSASAYLVSRETYATAIDALSGLQHCNRMYVLSYDEDITTNDSYTLLAQNTFGNGKTLSVYQLEDTTTCLDYVSEYHLGQTESLLRAGTTY